MPPTASTIEFRMITEWPDGDWEYLRKQVAGLPFGRRIRFALPPKLRSISGANVIDIYFAHNPVNGRAGICLCDGFLMDAPPPDAQRLFEDRGITFATWDDLREWTREIATMLL